MNFCIVLVKNIKKEKVQPTKEKKSNTIKTHTHAHSILHFTECLLQNNTNVCMAASNVVAAPIFVSFVISMAMRSGFAFPFQFIFYSALFLSPFTCDNDS